MDLVMLESPYSGNVELYKKYARRCMKDSIRRGECPLASHLLYTQEGILDDTVKEERNKGILCGYAWGSRVRRIIFYMDYGLSHGMAKAIEYYTALRHSDLGNLEYIDFQFRYIGKEEK